MKIDFLNKKADYIGIAGSVLCIIHCLVTPVLILTSTLVRHDTLRLGFLSLDYIFIAVNIVAVYFATRHATSPGIKRALWGFLAVFATALLLEPVSIAFAYLAYAASAGLVLTHLTNLRQHRFHQHTP